MIIQGTDWSEDSLHKVAKDNGISVQGLVKVMQNDKDVNDASAEAKARRKIQYSATAKEESFARAAKGSLSNKIASDASRGALENSVGVNALKLGGAVANAAKGAAQVPIDLGLGLYNLMAPKENQKHLDLGAKGFPGFVGELAAGSIPFVKGGQLIGKGLKYAPKVAEGLSKVPGILRRSAGAAGYSSLLDPGEDKEGQLGDNPRLSQAAMGAVLSPASELGLAAGVRVVETLRNAAGKLPAALNYLAKFVPTKKIMQNLKTAKGTATHLGDVLEAPPLMRVQESIARHIPLSGEENVLAQQQGDLESRANDIINRHTAIAKNSPKSTAKQVSESFNADYQKAKKQKNINYRATSEILKEEGFSPTLANTLKSLKELHPDLSQLGGYQAFVKDLEKTLAPKKSPQKLMEQAQQVRTQAQAEKKVGSSGLTDAQKLMELLRQGKRDITNADLATLEEAFLPESDKLANKFTQRVAEKRANLLEKEATEIPKDFHSFIENYKGTPEGLDYSTLKQIKNLIGKKASAHLRNPQTELKGRVYERVGKALHVDINEALGQLSPEAQALAEKADKHYKQSFLPFSKKELRRHLNIGPYPEDLTGETSPIEGLLAKLDPRSRGNGNVGVAETIGQIGSEKTQDLIKAHLFEGLKKQTSEKTINALNTKLNQWLDNPELFKAVIPKAADRAEIKHYVDVTRLNPEASRRTLNTPTGRQALPLGTMIALSTNPSLAIPLIAASKAFVKGSTNEKVREGVVKRIRAHRLGLVQPNKKADIATARDLFRALILQSTRDSTK